MGKVDDLVAKTRELLKCIDHTLVFVGEDEWDIVDAEQKLSVYRGTAQQCHVWALREMPF